ncbi:TPA: ATP-grasp domain-containing protein [Streptococcus suis]
MPEKHFPGETVGIIGSSIASALLAQEAGRLGYRVGSLVLTPENAVRQFATWQTIGESYDEMTLRHFAGRVDVIIAESGLLSNEDFQILKDITDITLSDDLVAITTDRLIEKAYLDSLHLLVAPFSMVTNMSDVKEAIEYIGFPCILKTTHRHLPKSDQSIVIYSEMDLPAAQELLDSATCILEAWIPSEKKASLTIARNERGEMLIYPIFEHINQGADRGPQIRYPISLHTAIDQEINRIGRMVADSLGLVGALTMEFLITSAGVVYINDAKVGLSDAAIFTVGSMSVNHFEATVRSVVGLPLPEIRLRSGAAISLQLPFLNIESVLTQLMMRTDWGFCLFNPVSQHAPDLIGQVIVTGDSIESCERQIQITELYDQKS